MKKSILFFALLLAAAGLPAAEANLVNNGSGDASAAGWPTATVNAGQALSGGGCLEFADRKWVYSDQTFDVDDSKTYRLKMNLRSAQATSPSTCFIGIAMYDGNGRLINAHHIGVVKNTETILIEDAKKGAKEIRVGDASSWKPKNQVAYNVKSDFSDLPNRNILGPAISVEQDGTVWKVSLKNPLKADLPAGTAVRQHVSTTGNAYCIVSSKAIPAEWKEYSAVISGRTEDGELSYTKFWPGAKTFKICIIPNYNPKANSALLVDDISLTVED